MTVIEMVGMVGAGKTTLASALSDHLADRGLRALRPRTAILEVLSRSLVGSISRALLRSTDSRRRALMASYKLVVRPRFMVRFATHHPRLTWDAVQAVRRSPLPIWHRRRILGLFLRSASTQLYLGPRLRSDEVLLLDEGLVHRAVNLFAWSSAGVDRSAVVRYLAQLPHTDLVVLVLAPLSACTERAGSRGLPKRLMDHDDETIARFMRNAAEIIDGLPDLLRMSRRAWTVVDNSGTTDAAVASLQAAVDAHLAADRIAPLRPTTAGKRAGNAAMAATPALVPTTPRFEGGPRLRRPRWVATTSRRPPPCIAADLVTEVLALFSVRAVGSVQGLSPTSRADNVIVPTSSGDKLLKRYKRSVAPAAIAHEHSILQHLAGRGFPSPRLTVAADGTTVQELAGRWYALYDYHPGYFHYNEYLWPARIQRDLVGLSARALASLHTALEDFTPVGANPNGFISWDGDRVRDIEWYLAGLTRTRTDRERGGGRISFLAMLHHDAGTLENELRALEAQLTSAALPREVVHGDFGPYNLLFKRGERIVILDFELARIDWRLTDLAKALQQFGVNRFGLQLPHITRFVAEYERQRPLAPRERRLLPNVWLFLTLRRIAVCWDRFTDSGNERWLAEARRKLDLAAMIRASADTLSALEGIRRDEVEA